MTTGEKVFGSRQMGPRHLEIAATAREAAGRLYEIMHEVTHSAPPEVQRLVAMAKTDLEKSVMCFTKALSRLEDK
jgi:hypothetical protein